MKYVEALWREEDFLSRLKRLNALEADRVYCRHDLEHFLSTARIAWIFVLEHGFSLEKEQVYLAALLHDLGRVEEYERKISHDEASVAFAGGILRRLGYDKEKTEDVCFAIGAHRKRKAFSHLRDDFKAAPKQWRREQLAEALAMADQLSRNCFLCPKSSSCKWREEEKTKGIIA